LPISPQKRMGDRGQNVSRETLQRAGRTNFTPEEGASTLVRIANPLYKTDWRRVTHIRAGETGANLTAKGGKAQMADMDIQIKGGTVVDGTRVPRFRGDVWITDGKIVQIGGRAPGFARKIIDADGLIVAPGFVALQPH